MRKKLYILSGILACGFMTVTPVFAQETENSSENVQMSESEETQDDILSQMEAANTLEAVLEKNGEIGIHTIYYDNQGRRHIPITCIWEKILLSMRIAMEMSTSYKMGKDMDSAQKVTFLIGTVL